MAAASPRAGSIPLTHLALALAVVAVWGTNFVVIKAALASFPPLLFAAIRFTFALLPAALFVNRPPVKIGALAAYGLLIGVGQFGLLYIAMGEMISPGLASLILQSQVFFTIALAMWRNGERLRRFQLFALLLATSGIGVILAHSGGSITIGGLILALLAAASWGGGNQVAREANPPDMFAFVIWSSLFAVPPLIILSLLFEGPATIASAIANAGVGAWGAAVWQAWGNSLFGYAAWGWLLARHPAATITPTAMLVPIFGMTSSALILGEAMPAWKVIAAALVMSGLILNLAWPMTARLRALPWRDGEPV